MSANFGPAAPWPVTWTCDTGTESPAVTGEAVMFATQLLWAMTGMRFGLNTVTLRPCRRECLMVPWPGGWTPWPGSWGVPIWPAGGWGIMGASCGGCAGSCSCGTLSEILLPAPVNEIITVKLDGVVLSGSPMPYRLDDNRILLRTDGGTWPICQDVAAPDTAAGTFSVTAAYGEDVPAGAAAAIGQVACEWIKALRGGDCSLPSNITSLVRQGVSITLPDLAAALENNRLGLRIADLFVHTWNPQHITARATTYSVDRAVARRPT